MDSLFIASYVARRKGIEPANAQSADSFYEQYSRSASTLAPLASAVVVVGLWVGLLSLLPAA